MDTKLENGDLAGGERNLPYAIGGLEEALQRAWLCLAIPKGSFRYLRQLGSRLGQLEAGEDERAQALCQEALELCPGFRVKEAHAADGWIDVTVETPEGTGQLRVPGKDGEEKLDGNDQL